MVERRLPPWEELQYVNLPVVTSQTTTGGESKQAVASNANRVVLMFSIPAGSQDVNLQLSKGGPDVYGLTGSVPSVIFTEKDHLWLCSAQWYWTAGAAANLIITEVILRQWPDEGGA